MDRHSLGQITKDPDSSSGHKYLHHHPTAKSRRFVSFLSATQHSIFLSYEDVSMTVSSTDISRPADNSLSSASPFRFSQTDAYRVNRGGSSWDVPSRARIASRLRPTPFYRWGNQGLRLARSL